MTQAPVWRAMLRMPGHERQKSAQKSAQNEGVFTKKAENERTKANEPFNRASFLSP